MQPFFQPRCGLEWTTAASSNRFLGITSSRPCRTRSSSRSWEPTSPSTLNPEKSKWPWQGCPKATSVSGEAVKKDWVRWHIDRLAIYYPHSTKQLLLKVLVTCATYCYLGLPTSTFNPLFGHETSISSYRYLPKGLNKLSVLGQRLKWDWPLLSVFCQAAKCSLSTSLVNSL